jgi:hypothetical protein
MSAMRTTPADLPALERLRAAIGGKLRMVQAAILQPLLAGYGEYASAIASSQVAHAVWLESTHDGLRVAIVSGINRHIEYAKFEPRQAVAVFLPESPIASLESTTRVRWWWPLAKKPKEAEVIHIFFTIGIDDMYAWRDESSQPPKELACGYQFLGCVDGVLFAVIDAATLDVDRARAALSELAALARHRWRPPTKAEIDAVRRKNTRFYVLMLLGILAMGVVVFMLNRAGCDRAP